MDDAQTAQGLRVALGVPVHAQGATRRRRLRHLQRLAGRSAALTAWRWMAQAQKMRRWVRFSFAVVHETERGGMSQLLERWMRVGEREVGW